MAFKKAKSGQAKIKMGIYGDAGSGKTPFALLVAEGLQKIYGGEVAFVDTERGTDFYTKKINERYWHKEAFNICVEHTKSILKAKEEIEKIKNDKTFTVVVIDSLTHLWESAKQSYSGKRTKHGGIPIYAWNKIKKPFKDLIDLLLECDKHVILCGRAANMYDEGSTEETMVKVGTKMKAEGDTAYEPNILFEMTPYFDKQKNQTVISATVKKDRSSVLYGKQIDWPNFENTIEKIMPYLNDGKHEHVKNTDKDDIRKNSELEANSQSLLEQWSNKINQCNNETELHSLKTALSVDKDVMTGEHVAELYEVFNEKKSTLKEKANSVLGKIK